MLAQLQGLFVDNRIVHSDFVPLDQHQCQPCVLMSGALSKFVFGIELNFLFRSIDASMC